MASKVMRIAGETFEVVNTPITSAPITKYDYDQIYYVYKNPSESKRKVWHYWCDWVDFVHKCYGNCECGIEIGGHNCMMFSINGQIRFYETYTYNGKEYRHCTKVYSIWITKEHNRIYEVQ